MSEKELGADFAVHGGGIDLVFPHHENEIAQTEAARGVPLAEIWMHNGMVQIDEEKMSKSVGNIFQLSEAIERYGAADRGRLSRLRALPPATRLLRRAASRGGGPGRPDPELPPRRARRASRTRSSPRSARLSSTRWPMTSTRRRHLRCSSRSSPRATSASSPELASPGGAAPAARARRRCLRGGGGARRGPGAARRARGGAGGQGLRSRRRPPRPARRDGLGGPRRGGRRPARAA